MIDRATASPAAGCLRLAAFARLRAVYVEQILPRTHCELDRWADRARTIEDPYWAQLAGDSLARKRFHSEGGSIFGVLPASAGYSADRFVARAVALQTGVDFLDDVSDRGGIHDERLVFQLHRYLCGGSRPEPAEALPATVLDWLGALRSTVWTGLEQEPGYPAVARWLRQTLVGYSRMQTISQAPAGRREHQARRWAARHRAERNGLIWQEHLGGHGSTISALLALALAPLPPTAPDAIDRLAAAYQPWLTTLHIALDSLLDLAEDRATGDFNSIAHLAGRGACRAHLTWLARAWAARVPDLPDAPFQQFVFHTLVNVYLGARDPETAAVLLAEAGLSAD